MALINRLKQSIAKGLSFQFGKYLVSFKVSRAQEATSDQDQTWATFNLRQANFLCSKYPFLDQLQLQLNEANAHEILQCFLDIIPAIDEQAREVCIRNALHRMRTTTQDPVLKNDATLEIARSDLRSGIPDRALILRNDKLLKDELATQLALSDQAYGAPLLSREWPDVSRGSTLCYYFDNHRDLLKDKTILHFSPEPELRDWILNNASALSLDYKTSNIAGNDVDFNQDLTAMTLTNKFDVVICHRVLEHVMDDSKAFEELYRILKPGGYMQISVPQSMHQAQTREWRVPDLTHHEHVRHYGSDFAKRLTNAGFEVSEDKWLLQQPAEQLLDNGSYPLRMYTARKPLID